MQCDEIFKAAEDDERTSPPNGNPHSGDIDDINSIDPMSDSEESNGEQSR